jgi:hypothetical protein
MRTTPVASPPSSPRFRLIVQIVALSFLTCDTTGHEKTLGCARMLTATGGSCLLSLLKEMLSSGAIYTLMGQEIQERCMLACPCQGERK